MNHNTLTVYIVNRSGIENHEMQDVIELFSGTLLLSGVPDRVDHIIKKRGYIVMDQPK